MTTEATTPNPNDPSADAAQAGEDTALAAAAKADAETGDDAGNLEGEGDAGDAGKGGEPETDPGAPDAYDTAAFAMPDGVEFDAEAFGALEPALRELNLSQDKAGKLVEAYAGKLVPLIQQRTADQIDEQAAELRATLARELQADPEVGGKKLDESRSFAAKAIAHFIPDAAERSEFSTFLNESGLGNNRFLMRLVAGAGRTLAEASTPASAGDAAERSNSELFYGKKAKG